MGKEFEKELLLFSCCVQFFCDLVDCSLPVSFGHGIFQEKYWYGLPFPSPGNLPNSRIELGSLALVGAFFYH